ncbi:MAG TPA: sigma-54-dependent Fis family transcriptional regulator [Desulfobulbaceae bacterium]|nr:sigma-54-dependent Fis family transcriptional regulator [Desulfobulbaceae bacterium]
MRQAQLLIVDDETDLLQGLQRMLAREFEELDISIQPDPSLALEFVEKSPVDLVLLDIQMPEINGLELLKKLRRFDQHLTIIMMTGYGTIEIAVEAMKNGAYDFITKPFDKTALFRTIGKGLEHNRLLRENINLRQRVCEKEPFANFVGQSKSMQRLYHGIRTTARTDYTVLITGESGTGKELTARAIHSLSKRRDQPLYMVNCPAIPEHLLESELFGHRKGAFTGAHRDQAGLFVEADKATLCLDEIGDIPVAVQTKLLRVLQEQEIKPLGSAKTRSVDVRIIASTNRNLEEKIKDHSFREDLFYRLNVVVLQTPTLMEIKEDIPLLTDHFTRQVCCELDLPEKHFSLEAVEELVNRPWPGNVRELQNVVRGAVLFCPDEVITSNYLRKPEGTGFFSGKLNTGQKTGIEAYKEAKEQAISSFTRSYVTMLLKETGGNVSRAAEVSGLTRAALQKIMRRHTILSSDYRNSSP